MGSEGVIQDPRPRNQGFHRDEKSWTRDPKVLVGTGVPVPDEPPLLKTMCTYVGTLKAMEELHRKKLGAQETLVGELPSPTQSL